MVLVLNVENIIKKECGRVLRKIRIILGRHMKKRRLEEFNTHRMHKEKQRKVVTYLKSMSKWMEEQMSQIHYQDLLKTTKEASHF